jgi:3',5'-cyclic AMP phosphodiesterase CpdA
VPSFRLAHLSDLHLAPPPGRAADLAPKRLLSRFAWRRKQYQHDTEALAAIAADVKAARPDHIAITGDLTNFSTREEFAAARSWLEALGPPAAITVSPGNHDALVVARGGDRFEPWRPWLGDDDSAQFPQARRRGPLAIINLCSARPTALHLAQGALDERQLQRLPPLLRQARAAGLFRVVLIHHPPAPDVVSPRKALRDAPQLLAILAAEGAELVLHGHAHEATVTTVPGPCRAIPVLGVPSASGVGGRRPCARWHEISVSPDGGDWSLEVIARGLIGVGERVGELGRYRLNPQRPGNGA